MSHVWQVVAVVDEIDREMRKSVRASEGRTKALDALAMAALNLCTAAIALLPHDVAQAIIRQVG